MNYRFLMLSILVGLLIWFSPHPEDVSDTAWHLLAIFIATIFGIITRPIPMGAVALFGLLTALLTNTLSWDIAFSGFSNSSVWLIVFAFFIARGFIKTGLGMRLSYLFMFAMGRRTLGLGYGVLASDLILAPAIPSNTARTGGVILPIVESLAKVFNSKPNDPSSRHIGSFLAQVAIQSSCVTSAMFLTSMAANPLIADLAAEAGIDITWGTWLLGSIVPGTISLVLTPLLVYYLVPPTIKKSPEAPLLATTKLNEMGKMKRSEWIMLSTFVLLIVLWAFSSIVGIKPSTTGLLGLVILLTTGVLSWDDIKNEGSAWETLIWFAVLLMMATELSKLGFTTWLSDQVAHNVSGFNWIIGFSLLSIMYFYSHYFFASNLAHVGAMYLTFLTVAISIGTPPYVASLLLGYFSSLFGAITHYACGPAAILFGARFLDVGTWWRTGLIISFVQIAIWLGIGLAWWKIIGFW